jgi:hypothetical protein
MDSVVKTPKTTGTFPLSPTEATPFDTSAAT